MADTIGKPDDTTAQIVRLREQVETLMKERVTPAVTEMAGRAETVAQTATGLVRDQAQTVAAHIRDQPLVAVLLAVGVGYLVGRTTR
jgi:ElaB/YqjD/DUF883 family membrane-anchored ribosome-binding protein